MPVMAIDRNLSASPYAVTHYYEVNSELGNLQDLQHWLNECHRLGLEVVLDIPLNHTSPAHEWVSRTDFYRLDNDGKMHAPVGTGWHDVVQLNHSCVELQRELDDVLHFWLKMGFDGFRYDAAAYMPKQLLQGLIASTNTELGKRLHHWCDALELFAEVEGMTAFMDHRSVTRLQDGELFERVLEQRHCRGIIYLTNHDSLHKKGSALKQWGKRYALIHEELSRRDGHLMLSFCEWRQPADAYSFLE